jgi:hypothetical protein
MYQVRLYKILRSHRFRLELGLNNIEVSLRNLLFVKLYAGMHDTLSSLISQVDNIEA